MLEPTIINAKKMRLKEMDIRDIVEIESHPKVKKWITERIEKDIEKEFQAYKSFFEQLRDNTKVEILVAYVNKRVVGFLALWTLGAYMEHVAAIGVSVHPDHMGKGIGVRLVESAMDIAIGKGLKRLEIETLADNTAMRYLAEKTGFKFECNRIERIFKDGSYHDEAVYYRLLK